MSGFMSAEFDLALIGAPLKLWISFSSSSVLLVISAVSCMLLCFFEQSLNLGSQSVSMRLRPKRYFFSYFIFSILLNPGC